jgi:hypothetical protein
VQARPRDREPMPFKITYPPHVRAKVKQLMLDAAQSGREERFFQLLAEVEERLRDQALSLGEALYTLPNSNIQIRHAIVGFLVVYWGVHEESGVVILKDYRLLPAW